MQIDVTVRVWVMIKPDSRTPTWVYYVREAWSFDAPPLVGDVLLVIGADPFELTAVGAGSFQYGPSEEATLLSVTVDKRYFTPTGNLVVNAILPYHLHERDDDPDDINPDEVWGRLDWGTIAATLLRAGFEQHEIRSGNG